MAFTAQEKARLLFYLGYSGFEDDGLAIRAINGLDAKEAFMGPIVREQLDFIGLVDREIRESLPLAAALEDGSIKIRAHYTLSVQRGLGRQYVGRLSSWTKIPIGPNDVFSPSCADPATMFSGDPSENRFDTSLGVPTKYT